MAHRRRQAAVIPYRIRNERLEVALVTTSNGKGWIVPKGSIDDGERPRDAAIREAEEEAGLRGIVARKPVGRYHHVNGDGRCRVDVYLMRVTKVLSAGWKTSSGGGDGCASPMRPTACVKSCRSSSTTSKARPEPDTDRYFSVGNTPAAPNRCTSSRAMPRRTRSRKPAGASADTAPADHAGNGSPCWIRSMAVSGGRARV